MFSELLGLILGMISRQSKFERAVLGRCDAIAGRCDAIAAQCDVIAERCDAIVAQQLLQRVVLQKILAAVTLPPAVKAVLRFQVDGEDRFVEGEHIEMKVNQNQKGTLTVTAKSSSGGPGIFDGIPTWKAEPDGVVTLTPSADALSCDVVTLPLPSGTSVASVVITFDGDGDLGVGVVDVVATATLTVIDPSSGAVVAEMAVGTFTGVAP